MNVTDRKIWTNVVCDFRSDIINTIGLCVELQKVGLVSPYIIERVKNESTRPDMNYELWGFLLRARPQMLTMILKPLEKSFNYTFVNKLRHQMGLPEVYPEVEQLEVKQDPPAASPSKVEKGYYNNIINAVDDMEPVPVKCDRSTKVQYKVSVTAYTDDLPSSFEIGMAELPYLIAMKLGVPPFHVSQWKDSPPLTVLNNLKTIFEKEVSSIKKFITQFKGGMEFYYELPETSHLEKIRKIVKTLLKHNFNNVQVLSYPTFDVDTMSGNEKTELIIMLYLMSFGKNTSFILRKDTPPKPSSYLYYNMKNVDSYIIKDEHKAIVKEIANSDESNVANINNMIACPW